jgi:hypothetical protein
MNLTLPSRMSTVGVLLTAIAAVAAGTSTPATAAAASADTTRAFCTQMQTSQAAIGAIPATSANRLATIAGEWSKIARFAPAALKADVDAIAAAYKSASAKPAAEQKAALSGIVSPAQKVTAFVSKSCATTGEGGPDGGGDRSAQFAQLRVCVTKKGGTLPDVAPGGGRDQQPAAGQTGQKGNAPANATGQAPRGGGPFGTLDAKSQAAFDACRTELGMGNGFGGGGGARTNPQVQACLKKKGITLPAVTPGQPPAAIDTKSRAALDACRTELGLGNGPGQPGAPGAPASGKQTPKATTAPTTTTKK